MVWRWRRVAAGLTLLVVVAGAFVGYQGYRAFSSVPHLFRRNAELKADGYYMAEFEFKMLAVLRMLSDGAYLDAYSTLNRIRAEMDTGAGLVRMPADASPEARFDFLIDRQDPSTGAFMDPAYPPFTYLSPTLNVVEALEELSRTTERPLKLKYPLRFLDAIATPEALTAYLDDFLYGDRFWSERFPGPGPYGVAVSEIAYVDLFERTGLYRFTPAWKEALRTWLDATQDPVSGFWGMRVGAPDDWHPRVDANSTFHILHLILTADGDDADPARPLRHGEAMAATLVGTLTAPMPDDEDGQHAWGLEQVQSAVMLTRYLWSHLDEGARAGVRRALAAALVERTRFYRPADGAFTSYLTSGKAEVDGTSLALSLLKASGCVPGTAERSRLWGEVAVPDAETTTVASFAAIEPPAGEAVNAWRVFAGDAPAGDKLDDSGVVAILYPGNGAGVLDLLDVRQNLARFLAGPARFGNWSSSDALREPAFGLDRPVREIAVVRGRIDDAAAAKLAAAGPDVTLVGYDVFQRPVVARHYRLAP